MRGMTGKTFCRSAAFCSGRNKTRPNGDREGVFEPNTEDTLLEKVDYSSLLSSKSIHVCTG